MALRRCGARLERREIDPELIEAYGIAKPFVDAAHYRLSERLGITPGRIGREIFNIDLRHSGSGNSA